MMHRRSLLRFALLTASLAVAVPASAADPPKPPSGTDAAKAKDRAKDLFTQGAAAYHAGRFADAEPLFLEAWSLWHTHDTAADLGLVQIKLGKLAEGAQHIAWALQNWPPSESAKLQRALVQELASVRAKLGALRIQPGLDGAEVTVNGRRVDADALTGEVFVEPGSVTVTASRPGYVSASRTLIVATGAEAATVVLELKKSEPPPVPESTPRTEKRPVWPAIAAGSVSVVALAIGGGLAGAGNAKRVDAYASRTQLATTNRACATPPLAGCQTFESALSSEGSFDKAALGSFIAGGALAVTAAALGLWAASGAKPSVSVVPVVGRNQVGAMMEASW